MNHTQRCAPTSNWRAARFFTVPVAAAFGLLVSILTACTGDSEATVAAERAARDSAAMILTQADVATATLATISSTLAVSGPLQPKDVVSMRAQVDGTISSLTVDRGSRVRRGQRLATLNAAGVIGRAAGARAALAAAQSNLAVARQQLDAAIRLYAAGGISELERKTAEAAFEAAESQVAAAEAQVAGADEQAGYATVVSPIDGVVSSRLRQQGENVRVGDEILSIVNGATLELSGQIGVGEASRVRVGAPVEFALDAFAGDTFQGRVARIDPIADAGTRQVGVYVELPNPRGRIIGGQYARGRIMLGDTRGVVIPATAVRGAASDSAGAYVFVLRDGRLTRRTVVIGDRDEATGRVVIASGLEAGEQVIATPSAAVTEGLRVQLGPDADRSARAPSTVPLDSSARSPSRE